MSLTPEWLPNIHPMLVHFPIALFFLGVLLDFLFLVSRKKEVKNAAMAFLGLGTVFVIAVYFSGRNAADTVLIPADAQLAVNEHSDWALRTTVFFLIYVSGRFIADLKFPGPNGVVTAMAVVFGALGLFFLYETAEHGGKLVFQHGVGVQAVEKQTGELQRLLAEHADPGIIELEDGSWVWRPVSGAAQVLEEQFTWLEQTVSAFETSIVNDPEMGNVLALRSLGSLDESALFVTGEPIESIQADIAINIRDFTGFFMLVHHVQDARNYDFLSLEDTTMKLGRVLNGAETVFDEKPIDLSGDWLDIGVFGGGGHFRGNQNGSAVTHGHAEDLPPGRSGFRIKGSGIVYIKQVSVQALQQ